MENTTMDRINDISSNNNNNNNSSSHDSYYLEDMIRRLNENDSTLTKVVVTWQQQQQPLHDDSKQQHHSNNKCIDDNNNNHNNDNQNTRNCRGSNQNANLHDFYHHLGSAADAMATNDHVLSLRLTLSPPQQQQHCYNNESEHHYHQRDYQPDEDETASTTTSMTTSSSSSSTVGTPSSPSRAPSVPATTFFSTSNKASASPSSPSSFVKTSSSSFSTLELKNRLLLRLALRLRDATRLKKLVIDAAAPATPVVDANSSSTSSNTTIMMNPYHQHSNDDYYCHQQQRQQQQQHSLDSLFVLIQDLPIHHSTMHHLSLIRCGLGPLHAVALGRALCRTHTLQSLNVSHNHWTHADAKPIFNSLVLGGSNLHCLIMNDNPLEPSVMEDVSRVLQLNTSLQRLSLHSSIPSNFVMTTNQAHQLGMALCNNRTLLHLSTNIVDAYPPFHMAQGLSKMIQLQYLSWPCCTAPELVMSRILSSKRHAALHTLAIRTSCATLRTVAHGLWSTSSNNKNNSNHTLRKLILFPPETCAVSAMTASVHTSSTTTTTSESTLMNNQDHDDYMVEDDTDEPSAKHVSRAIAAFLCAMQHNMTLQELVIWNHNVILALEPKEFKERYQDDDSTTTTSSTFSSGGKSGGGVGRHMIVQAIASKLQLASFYAQLNACGRSVLRLSSSQQQQPLFQDCNNPIGATTTTTATGLFAAILYTTSSSKPPMPTSLLLLPTVLARAKDDPKLMFVLLQGAVAVANQSNAAAGDGGMARISSSSISSRNRTAERTTRIKNVNVS